MSIKFLKSERIYLRQLQEEDLKGNYLNWLNDDEVCENNSHHVYPYNIESAKDYINYARNTRNDLILAICLNDNDKHIGNISIQSINYPYRNGEFAILLGEKDYWNKGYSKESSIMIVKHAFDNINLHRIYCGTTSNNIGMQKLADSLGMKKEGVRRDAFFKKGKFQDIIEYGILRDEFYQKFNFE